MKILCVNDKEINLDEILYLNTFNGGVKEGKIYETLGEVFKNIHNHECYYITGKGPILAMRFTKALPTDVLYEYTSIKTEEPVLN